jgi:hypothetical protein
MFKDPVCKMMVDEGTAKHVSEAGVIKSTSAQRLVSRSSMLIQRNTATDGTKTASRPIQLQT